MKHNDIMTNIIKTLKTMQHNDNHLKNIENNEQHDKHLKKH